MKIDGSFMSHLIDDPYSELAVNFIAGARLYGKKSLAEHVEHLQLEKLDMLGIDYSQGYLTTGKLELLFDPSLS